MKSLWRRTVVPHQCVERAIPTTHDTRLDIACAAQRRARTPGAAPIVSNGHERKGEAIRIKRDNEALAVKDEWMRAGHPAETATEFVRGLRAEAGKELRGPVARLRRQGLSRNFREGFIGVPIYDLDKIAARRDVQDFADFPFRRTLPAVIRGDAVFHERSVPLVGENRWPQQPQSSARIDEHGAVRVRVIRSVGHRETLAPGPGALAFACPFDLHVIRSALTRAVKPTNEQITIGRFDDARSVVVPVFKRENQFGFDEWRLGGEGISDERHATCQYGKPNQVEDSQTAPRMAERRDTRVFGQLGHAGDLSRTREKRPACALRTRDARVSRPRPPPRRRPRIKAIEAKDDSHLEMR